MKRVTNDMITELLTDEVFVFGSNLSGIHGAGAAKLALTEFGATLGNPIGMQGQTYAIPTKSENYARTLELDMIKHYVNQFIGYTEDHPELTFLVTEIGCGLAGYDIADVAPLFEKAKDIENVHMPKKFWEFFMESSLNG